MTPQIKQATASRRRKIRFLTLFCLFLTSFCGSTHALYHGEMVTAYPLPATGVGSTIVVDGSPDSIWKAISSKAGAVSEISFLDYKRLVILPPVSVAVVNDDPSKYIKNPVNGSVKMLAAYDKGALYFLFLVKTKTVFNPKTLCSPTVANLWKADAPELYIDPSPWDPDTAVYPSYFSADSSGLVYGTSPKTIQLAKPISTDETRHYFRNRATADKFQIAVTPMGLSAVSKSNSATDTATVIVEMRIPFWAGASTFAGGKSMFISWGFNMYPDSLWGNCNGTPLGYRWAKHYLNYDQALDKPPGWRAKDSTHYDPTRSWDGWGRFHLSTTLVDTRHCKSADPSKWDMAFWQETCRNDMTVGLESPPKSKRAQIRSGRDPGNLGAWGRDIRGRSIKGGSNLLIFPWDSGKGFGAPGTREATPL